MPPLIRDLEIDFTALSLVTPEKVSFRYKLEGWDRDWQDVGTRREAFYSNLPPRNCTFRAKACNNSGVWNEAGTFLDFSVAPAYYQTWWFRSLCVLAFLALLWGLHQLRLRQLPYATKWRVIDGWRGSSICDWTSASVTRLNRSTFFFRATSSRSAILMAWTCHNFT